MRRIIAGLTALVVICIAFTPADTEAGRRRRRCCQPCCVYPPVKGGSIFCAQSLMMKYVDAGGTTHWMYSGQYCDGCPTPGNCSGGGYNSPTDLNVPPAKSCAVNNCTQTRILDCGLRGSVKKGDCLKKPVKYDPQQPHKPEPGVNDLGPFFIQLPTTTNTITAELHYLGATVNNKVYVVRFGFEISNYSGPFTPVETVTQPDPVNTPAWYKVTLPDVDGEFDVLTTCR